MPFSALDAPKLLHSAELVADGSAMHRAGKTERLREDPGRPRVAIVTGGSSGIGLATCRALAAGGFRIIVVARDAGRVAETVASITSSDGPAIHLGLTLDTRSEHDMGEMVSRTLSQFGRIDVLVCCAGIGKNPESKRPLPSPVARMPVEEWDAVLDTNLRGTFLSNRAVLPTMITQGKGDIINISSSPGGLRGQPLAAAYCASKFGVVGLSEALARDVSPYGVRVQVVLPDATDTPLLHNTGLSERLGPPIPAERVAAWIAYLVAMPDDGLLIGPIIAPSRLSYGARR
jgi:NAD(P)-dependent dehydrogenase (short-subunit alcohol dehydrogenase family)